MFYPYTPIASLIHCIQCTLATFQQRLVCAYIARGLTLHRAPHRAHRAVGTLLGFLMALVTTWTPCIVDSTFACSLPSHFTEEYGSRSPSFSSGTLNNF